MATICLTTCVSLVCKENRGLNLGPHNEKEDAALADPKIHLLTEAAQTVQSPFNLEVTSVELTQGSLVCSANTCILFSFTIFKSPYKINGYLLEHYPHCMSKI